MRLIDADELKELILAERDKIPKKVPCATYELMREKDNQHGNAMRGGIRVALRCMENTPTIEAEPVRHGRWEWYEEWGPSTWLEPPDIINAGWKCTECGIDLGEYLTAKLHEEVYVGDMDKMPEVDRCPNCGAKMDLKGD